VGDVNPADILQQVRQTQLQLNITPEYKLYISLCGIFGPHRNIVKHWDKFEAVFTSLIGQDEDMELIHFFQAIVLFFINRYPDQQKFASSFCKKLYDNSMFEDEFFIKWHSRKLRLDKGCVLYDRPAESAMRPLISEFVVWIQNTDYDAEEGYGEEEEPTADDEEEKTEEEVAETED